MQMFVQRGEALRVAAALVLLFGCANAPPAGDAGEGPAPGGASAATDVSLDADRGGGLRVTLHGIGSVRAGMSIAEASAALGVELGIPPGGDPAGCTYLEWPGAPQGVAVMVEGHRIARVEVRSGATATTEGARIGDSDERIRRLYAGRVTASPHKYTTGQYLTVTPASPADEAFRLVFETESGRVTQYRSGSVPQVEYVEGCS